MDKELEKQNKIKHFKKSYVKKNLNSNSDRTIFGLM